MRRVFWKIAVPVVLAAIAGWARESTPQQAERKIQRGFEISRQTKFCTPSYWSWELQLATVQKDRELAGRIAKVLYGLQKPDGRWALGTDWTFNKDFDFKARTAEDAETWEVAEAGNALLDYAATFGDREAYPYVLKAAEYLKTGVRRVQGKPYLPHMIECNNILQPHSTICTALLFQRLKDRPEFVRLGKELEESGRAMNFKRIIIDPQTKDLDAPKPGTEIVNYEKVQVGFYLLQMGNPKGKEILAGFDNHDIKDRGEEMAAAYHVLVELKLSDFGKAKRIAEVVKDFQPKKGYDYALRDIIDYGLSVK
jgi:hypothetical protein